MRQVTTLLQFQWDIPTTNTTEPPQHHQLSQSNIARHEGPLHSGSQC